MCLRFWNLWAGGANKRAKIPYTGCQGNKEQGWQVIDLPASLILSALMDTCSARWHLVIHAENFPHWKGASYVSSKRLA